MAISEKPLTLEQPPDLVVEIASPRQSINGLVRRCIWYTENGVGIALLVDPADESVLDFRPGAAPKPLRGDDEIELSALLTGFRLNVKERFDSLNLR